MSLIGPMVAASVVPMFLSCLVTSLGLGNGWSRSLVWASKAAAVTFVVVAAVIVIALAVVS